MIMDCSSNARYWSATWARLVTLLPEEFSMSSTLVASALARLFAIHAAQCEQVASNESEHIMTNGVLVILRAKRCLDTLSSSSLRLVRDRCA